MKPGTRALFAEALGSALLLAIVAGSGIMAEQLAGGNVALALLANSLATGAGLFVLIMLFGPISGAHFNPAVSLVACLQKQLSVPTMLKYCVAQIGGAVSGVWATHLMFDLAVQQSASKIRSTSNLWWAEFIATFGLILTIQGFSRRKLALPACAAMVALYIVAAYWFTASTSFANPAVTLARSLTNTFTGIRLADVAGFIVAQYAGALCALACARALFAESPATE
jgi:glycerol uptake facilitator-like aquaporin